MLIESGTDLNTVNLNLSHKWNSEDPNSLDDVVEEVCSSLDFLGSRIKGI